MTRLLTGWLALVAWFIGSAVWLAGAGPAVIGHEDQPAAVTGPRFESVQPDVFGVSGGQPGGWADVDGDGDLDLFVGMKVGLPNRLFLNDNGVFKDVAGEVGVADVTSKKLSPMFEMPTSNCDVKMSK